MKNFFLFTLVILATCLLSCSGTKNTNGPVAQDNNITYLNLADYLRQNTSVMISGEGQSIRLQIRGINSAQGDTRPFIYLDRIPMGRDYTRANSAINPNNIKRVEVISSLSRLAIYGEDGNSGIIKIHSKKDLSQ